MSISNMTSIRDFVHMFQASHAPGTFTMAQMMSLAIALIAVPINCSFFGIVLKLFRKRNQKDRNPRRLILGLVLGNLSCSIVATALWSIGMAGFRSLDPTLCDIWARFGAFLFGFSNFFSYCILYMRCDALSVLSGSGAFEKLLFKVVFFAVKLATACVPLIAILVFVMFEGKTYFVEKYCIPGVQGSIPWIFLALDTSLSSGYLFLFILPVMIHMRNIKSVVPMDETGVRVSTKTSQRSSRGDAVKFTAIRNLKISSTAIVSTFIYMVGNSLTYAFVSSEDESILPYIHFTAWQFYAGATDMLVNGICNMLITKKLWESEPTPLKRPKTDHNNDKRGNGISHTTSSVRHSEMSLIRPPSSLGLFA